MPSSCVLPPPADSVERLYHANHGWLQHWLWRRLGCADGAADLAHDTFVRLLAKPEAVARVQQPRAYLTTVARGLLNDHWRRLSLERAWLETLAALPQPLAMPPEEELAALQALRQLDDLLGRLAPRTREVFVLSQLEGLDYAAIAARVGVSERTVKRDMAQGFELCLSLID
ncbi:MAG: putative RNA polymerase sigma factor FecI [Paracidovorax wautersii]|uniref:Putative RNA polymerase sigma factor FecI n=1 Tax=Paracidovorax wautersii TaxID=1177982 RepID=A0A7V8JSC3_9BURK|nr:MAG: putative RNA polymerase sigma factor FecI [Paracidovorax wautersii]